MQTVAFIGLGAMGAPMARNIHKAGFKLGVYNRGKARVQAFRDEGFTIFTSPAEAVMNSDAAIIMVTDPAALSAILEAADGILAGLQKRQSPSSCLIINMSTVSPMATLDTAAKLNAAGARFVDAPVSGTVKPAQDGTLIILAAGNDADVTAAMPLLQAMGKAVVRCGDTGQATRMKLVLNLILAGMMQTLAEGLSLADSLGLDGLTVLETLNGGPLGAGLYQMKGGMMLKGEFAKQFSVDLMFKDLNLVLETAGLARLALPMTAAVRESFNAARGLGLGDHDMAAVIQVLQQRRSDAD